MLSDLNFYKVLDIQEDIYNDENYRIALKEYGVVYLQEDDWVECAFGIWDLEDAPWNNK